MSETALPLPPRSPSPDAGRAWRVFGEGWCRLRWEGSSRGSDTGQRKQKENHTSLKGSGASKMKTRNKMLKMKAEAKSFPINLWQSKNTEVFVPIRIYTDPLTKVLWIMQLASSPPAWLLPIWHDDVRRTPLVRHDFFREGGKPLTWPQSPCQHVAPLCTQAPCWLHNSTVPQPQLSRRFRQHRPNWPRKVNAHSMFLHSFPNRIQCQTTAKAASRNSIYWPLPEMQAASLHRGP